MPWICPIFPVEACTDVRAGRKLTGAGRIRGGRGGFAHEEKEETGSARVDSWQGVACHAGPNCSLRSAATGDRAGYPRRGGQRARRARNGSDDGLPKPQRPGLGRTRTALEVDDHLDRFEWSGSPEAEPGHAHFVWGHRQSMPACWRWRSCQSERRFPARPPVEPRMLATCVAIFDAAFVA